MPMLAANWLMLVSWLWPLHGQSLAAGGEKYQACTAPRPER